MNKLFMIAFVVVGGILLNVLFGLIVAIFVQMLWNWICPTIFNLPILTYWQAWGLYVLVAFLSCKPSVSSSSN